MRQRLLDSDTIAALPTGKSWSQLGVTTVADGRIPAQTPYFESVSAPGVYFAGNATQGATGMLKTEQAGLSSAVGGFRYNARLLAHHIADQHFGRERRSPALPPGRVVSFLLDELTRSSELWVQRGYLARVLTFGDDGVRDEGTRPLTSFVDEAGPDAVAAVIELRPDASIGPVVYVRTRGTVNEHALEPHQLHTYQGDTYAAELAMVLSPLLAAAPV